MSEKQKNVPRLRFPKFTGEWEKHKLGDCCDQLTATLNPQDTPNDIFAEYSMPAFDNGEIPNIVTGNTMNSARKILDRPCLLINKLNVRKKRIWNVEKPEKNAVSSAEFVPVYSDEINLKFLKYIVLNDSFTAYLEDCSSGTSNSQKRVTPDVIMSSVVLLPSKMEQNRIADFLTNFDTLITLQQRKLDQIKEYKKGMLQKMFPKEGETVPEVRFPGFDGEWKRRKLGDISYSFEYGLNAAAKEYDGQNKYIRITDISDETHEFMQSDVTSPDIDLSQADNYKLKEGDILFARTGASVGKSYLYRPNDGLVYFAGFLIRARIKKEYNPSFVFQNTMTTKYKEYIAITSQRSGQPGVNAQEYSQYTLMIPNRNEQDQISELFQHLDTLITLHQRKLEAMKEYKKGLLQQMFV